MSRRGRIAKTTAVSVVSEAGRRRTRLRTVGDRAFRAAAARLWNYSLPVDVVASQSLATFKERLKTFLFEQSFDHYGLCVSCP